MVTMSDLVSTHRSRVLTSRTWPLGSSTRRTWRALSKENSSVCGRAPAVTSESGLPSRYTCSGQLHRSEPSSQTPRPLLLKIGTLSEDTQTSPVHVQSDQTSL